MKKEDIFQKMIQEEASTKQRLFFSSIYLFSTKGFAKVGIRELCRSVHVKESSFYNHYSSKDELFKKILDYFTEESNKVVLTDEEIQAIVTSGNIRYFFEENMKKFSSTTNNPLYHTILQIILMECYTNAQAYALAKNNLYHLRRGYTEKVLKEMMDHGYIKECNVEEITAEYYYALKGLLDDYLLHEVWNGDTNAIRKRIETHIRFFTELLKK